MRFEIWQSRDYAESALGYRPGIFMERVWKGDTDELQLRYEYIGLEAIFAAFQRVDDNHMPPDNYTGRSLSVGDLVRLDDKWFSVEMVGFKEVTTPPVAA